MHSQSASSIAGEKETEGTVVVEMLINAQIHMASQRLHILQVTSSDYVASIYAGEDSQDSFGNLL